MVNIAGLKKRLFKKNLIKQEKIMQLKVRNDEIDDLFDMPYFKFEGELVSL